MDVQLIKLVQIEQKQALNLAQLLKGGSKSSGLADKRNRLAAMKEELIQLKRTEERLQARLKTCQDEVKYAKGFAESWQTRTIEKIDTLRRKTNILVGYADAMSQPEFGIKQLKSELEGNLQYCMSGIKPLSIQRNIIIEDLEKIKSLEEQLKQVQSEAENLMAPTH